MAAFWQQCEARQQLPPLVTLGLPYLPYFGPMVAPEVEDVLRDVPMLLQRLTELRCLKLRWAVTTGRSLLPLLPASVLRGLHRLELEGADALSLPKSAALSLPQLTELAMQAGGCSDGGLRALLAACPALLRLSLTRVQLDSWAVVHIAARCCPGLLSLTVRAVAERASSEPAAVGGQQLALGAAFLPQLISLQLQDAGRSHLSGLPYDFAAIVQRFTQPPSAALRSVSLTGRGLTAQLVASLSCLPSLRHLHADGDGGVAEAQRRATMRLEQARLTPVIPHQQPSWPPKLDSNLSPVPLGPQQLQQMRQRVLDEVPSQISLTELLLQEMASQRYM